MENLATAQGRRQGLEDLVRGIPIVNERLGLRLSLPSGMNWDPAVLASEVSAAPELYYGQLLGAVFDRAVTAPERWADLLPQVDRALPDSEWIDTVYALLSGLPRLPLYART
jgi:hypothetical protein